MVPAERLGFEKSQGEYGEHGERNHLLNNFQLEKREGPSVPLKPDPVAMLIIGMLMADMDMQHLRSYRQLWKPVLLRLIVLPVILVCVAKYSGLAALAPHGETLIIISLLSVIAPSANIVPQFSQMFGRDALYASLINTVTMLLCIITMPLMITLFQM